MLIFHRPQHALYEGAVPMMLCFNHMLPFLARLLVHRAFRDYNTVEELLSITPPRGRNVATVLEGRLAGHTFLQGPICQDV